MKNDLGTIRNMTHGRWARLFLISLKRILHYLRYSDFLGFEATTFNPTHTSKKRRSRRYAQNNGVPAGTSHKTPGTKKRMTFKFELDVPKTGNDIIRIDDEAGNRHWQKLCQRKLLI